MILEATDAKRRYRMDEIVVPTTGVDNSKSTLEELCHVERRRLRRSPWKSDMQMMWCG